MIGSEIKTLQKINKITLQNKKEHWSESEHTFPKRGTLIWINMEALSTSDTL